MFGMEKKEEQTNGVVENAIISSYVRCVYPVSFSHMKCA